LFQKNHHQLVNHVNLKEKKEHLKKNHIKKNHQKENLIKKDRLKNIIKSNTKN